MLRTDEGSQRDHVRSCLLLDLHWGLGEGKAGVSTVSAECAHAAYPFLEVLKYLLAFIEIGNYLQMK